MTTIAVLLLSFAGPLPAPLDTLVDVGGYHLHMVVYRGTWPVTIVMESGGGASLAAWSDVEVRLADRTGATVVAYDRGSDHDIPEMRPEVIVEAVLSIRAA
jgi:pimeloyl-ACP methyl ester carboxylesterase